MNYKLRFSDRFQFLISLLDTLLKNLAKDDFQYLSQKFDSDILNPVKQKNLSL